jgi:hypothetical protein
VPFTAEKLGKRKRVAPKCVAFFFGYFGNLARDLGQLIFGELYRLGVPANSRV